MKFVTSVILTVFLFCPLSAWAAKDNGQVPALSGLPENGKTATPATQPKNKKPEDVSIMGDALANQQQAVNFIKKYSPEAKLNCSIEEIVSLYFREAAAEGIRPDVALAQALLETGFFRYGGDVKFYQNNFCGLGSVGGGHKGATFTTPELGVRAHIQHLLAYSSKQAPKTKIVDPRYEMVTRRPDIFGVCKTWKDLDGRWAARGVAYGERILDVHARMMLIEPFSIALETRKPEAAPAAGDKDNKQGTPADSKKDKKNRKK